MRRFLLLVLPRLAYYASGAVAWLIALIVLSSCASAPASREKPQIACRFDPQRRFEYVLVVARDSFEVKWIRRRLLTQDADAYDTEEHTDLPTSIRMGWCPDEAKSVTGRAGEVWRQEEPEGRKDRDR